MKKIAILGSTGSIGSKGSKGVVRRIKISSAAKLYIWGIGTLYELCVPSTPVEPSEPSEPNEPAQPDSRLS